MKLENGIRAKDAILVRRLGKRYSIGEFGKYIALRDVLGATFNRLIWKDRTAAADGEIWALRDVTLRVSRGEVLGIIGANGAGKSTLLRILGRITRPTEGDAWIGGKVASLLELSTGFHSELTGRENAYFNGALLGMRKVEIDRYLNDIIAFAGVERFVDTPVKHYSSGMRMRLGFAVAAYLEPDILLVDEVLAVGDSAFQQKSLGKMNDIASSGRTVVFVSHDMNAVQALCSRVLWLDGGKLMLDGSTTEVTSAYLAHGSDPGNTRRTGYSVNHEMLNETAKSDFAVLDVEVVNPNNPTIGSRTGDPQIVRIKYRSSRKAIAPAFQVAYNDQWGRKIFTLNTNPIGGFHIDTLFPYGEAILTIDELPLIDGRYSLDIAFGRERSRWEFPLVNAVQFDVKPHDYYGSGYLPPRQHGIIVTRHHWDHLPTDPIDDKP